MKTVEDLLEKGLIEVANKEEELKVSVCLCVTNPHLAHSSLVQVTLHFTACLVITIPNGQKVLLNVFP